MLEDHGDKVDPEKAAIDFWEGERDQERLDRDPEFKERWLSAREMLFEPIEESAPVFTAMWKTAVSHDERIMIVFRYIDHFPAGRVFEIFPWLRDAVAIDPDVRRALEVRDVPLEGI